MALPDLASLSLSDPGPESVIPDDIRCSSDRHIQKLKSLATSLPYSIEPNSRMQSMLAFICKRIVQAVDAKDYDPGFLQWDSMLTYWSYLRYPIPKETRILLVKLYYHLAAAPGMPLHIVATCADALETLTRSKKKLSVHDIRLPWMPLYNIISQDLFLTRRQFEVSQASYYTGYIAETVRRFFHPAAIEEMLSVFVPLLNGTVLDVWLSQLTSFHLPTWLITASTEFALLSVLPVNLSSAKPPAVVSAYALHYLEVGKFLHV